MKKNARLKMSSSEHHHSCPNYFLPQDNSREKENSESNTQQRSKRSDRNGSGAASAIARVGAGSSVGRTCGSGLGAAGMGGAVNGGRGGNATGCGKGRIEERRSVGDTVGRGRNFGLVRDGTDRTQRLRGLGVGLDLTACIRVNTGEVLVVTLARLECTVLGVVGGVVGAPNTIVDVLAEVGSVGTSRVTDLEAEHATSHEIVPFDDLLVTVVVSV